MYTARLRSFTLLAVLVGSFVWAGVALQTAQAAPRTGTILVATTGTDVNTCGTETQPCATIPYAVNLTRDYSSQIFGTAEIRVAAGTYKQSIGTGANPDARWSIAMLNFNGTLTLRGGYSTGNWNVSDPVANQTIIDGEGKYRPVSIVPTNKNVSSGCNIEVSGFTIQNGLATRAMYDGPAGGGIIINQSCANARLSNLTIKNSRADGSIAGTTTSVQYGIGGGIAVQGGVTGTTCTAPTIVSLTNITLTSNVAQGAGGEGNGGGLYVYCGKITANGLAATNNTVQGGATTEANGGGISLIYAPTFTLNNIQVLQNTTTSSSTLGQGGGMFIELSSGTIDTAAIRGNKANGAYATGGGIFTTDNSSFALSNADITQNSLVASRSYAAGGGLLLTNSSATAAANAFVGRNLFIAGNSLTSPTSSAGGGIHCGNATLSLNNATLASNSLNGAGDNPGAALALIGGCAAKVSNSIVSNDTRRGAIFTNDQTGAGTFDTTLINSPVPFEDNSNKITKTNVFGGDPKFVSANDFHLADGSAAIDKATGGPAAETRDIDGETRPQGAASDVGADEFSTTRASVAFQVSATTSVGSITLNWNAPNPFVSAYQIAYEPTTMTTQAVKAPITVTVPGTQTSYTITGLTTDATYNITVTALDSAGAPVGVGTSSVHVTTPTYTYTYLPLTVR